MKTFILMDSTKQTKQERVEALSLLIFLVYERDSRVKSRGCADVQKLK